MAEDSKKEQLWFDTERKTIVACTALAAEYFGVTPQTLSNWAKESEIRYSYGNYDIKATSEYRNRVMNGTIPGLEPKKSPEEMTAAESKLYYENLYKAEQAKAISLKNQISQGDYLARTVVVSDLKAFFVVLKRSLEGLTGQIMNELSSAVGPDEAKELTTVVDDIIAGALEQLSVEGVYHAGD